MVRAWEGNSPKKPILVPVSGTQRQELGGKRTPIVGICKKKPI
jgi:hypothetical protein